MRCGHGKVKQARNVALSPVLVSPVGFRLCVAGGACSVG